jgi:hypothetical protein
MVFTNATLKEMSETKPTTPQQFEGINGVGKIKLRDYGDRFTTFIKNYLSQKQLPPITYSPEFNTSLFTLICSAPPKPKPQSVQNQSPFFDDEDDFSDDSNTNTYHSNTSYSNAFQKQASAPKRSASFLSNQPLKGIQPLSVPKKQRAEQHTSNFDQFMYQPKR